MNDLKYLTMSSGEFKRLYFTMTYKQLQEKFGWTTNQIVAMAKRLGIEKPKGRRKTRFVFSDEVE